MNNEQNLNNPQSQQLNIADVSSSALLEIGKAAIDNDKKKVRELLATGINYRLAYLYVERFFQNDKASELIQKEAKCKCGAVATKWNPKPICGNCSFQKAMLKIEYG
jgi:hypothetical protein